MTLVTARQLKGLFVSVVSIRIAALLLTFYAIDFNPLRFYERNPVTSPVFEDFGNVGATILYTIILLVAMVVIYDSVNKTHPRFYTLLFGFYYVILFISAIDLLNDVLIVFSLQQYLVTSATLSAIALIQVGGSVIGKDLPKRFARPTNGQRFALFVLMWPFYLYKSVVRL